MFKPLFILAFIALIATPSFAKSKRTHRRVAEKNLNVKTVSQWQTTKDSVVKIKGVPTEQADHCSKFEVKLSSDLAFNILCDGFEKVDSIKMRSHSQYSVVRQQDYTTITKYSYLTKRTQVSRLEQSILKVPFVEEIIHLKKMKGGQLAFYYESFRVDEFGRIVQDQFVQAHSLQKAKLEISAN